MERPFLRDVSFYIMSGFWAFYIFWRQEIRISDSIGFLVIYIIYIIVVVVGRYINQKFRQDVPYLMQVTFVINSSFLGSSNHSDYLGACHMAHFLNLLILSIRPSINTGCNKPCDFFFLSFRETKSHQILVIKDSFCSWVTTILLHKCNFSHSPILCLSKILRCWDFA